MNQPDRIIEVLVPVTAVATFPIGIRSFVLVNATVGTTAFVVGWFLCLPFWPIDGKTAGRRSKTADRDRRQRIVAIHSKRSGSATRGER